MRAGRRTLPDAMSRTPVPARRRARLAGQQATRPATSWIIYGTTELTEVPQLAMPSLVPPHVASVRVNAGGRQFGYWM
jgi:hypothetical protein